MDANQLQFKGSFSLCVGQYFPGILVNILTFL
jgi:hypothetical protein